MSTYYIRTTNRQALLDLAVQIGLLYQGEDQKYHMTHPHMGIWDEVGEIAQPTGVVIDGQPVLEYLTDTDGVRYWHANLMLFHGFDLAEIAKRAYERNPTVALGEALADLGKYFLTDEDGKPRAPGHPTQVFA